VLIRCFATNSLFPNLTLTKTMTNPYAPKMTDAMWLEAIDLYHNNWSYERLGKRFQVRPASWKTPPKVPSIMALTIE